ncbi:MAG TPA: stage V sporulation protein AC [Candidatus Fimousia stercorigallinarum]|nr:stage V sporulation protein AC [Candidatus Fimousia stercorigallinarum]
MKREPTKQEYQEYVEQITPKNNCFINCCKAFFVGGLICTLGEVIKQFAMQTGGWKEEDALTIVTLSLVLLSVLLTGWNLFAKIADFAGAGTLVPITGFANSVASPAIEYQKEGQVFGIGVKIFTIAGPVILYGVFSSWIIGLGYWIFQTFF